MIGSWKKYIPLDDSDFFDFGNGLWTGKKQPFQTVTVIRNTNFTDSGKIDYSNVAVLEVEKRQFEQRKLIKGDIIIERSGGGPKQPVGRVVYFDKNDGDYSFSNFTSRIRVINQELDTKFVFYSLMYFYNAGNTFEMQAQTTGIRNLDFSKYKSSVQVPFIERHEQSKISYVLSTIQKAIEQQEKLIRHTTELKKALMQKLFTEGTKGEKQKQTEIGLVPVSWDVTSIGNKKTLMQYGTSVKCDYEQNGFPVIRIPNVLSGKIDISDLKYGVPKSSEVEKLKLRRGDLIFVRTNGAKELTGRCAIFNDEIENCYYASYLIKVQFDETEINPEFINYYTQTEKGKSYLSGKANRTADGKYNINTGTLNNVLIPKPILKEQNEIVKAISLTENKIAVQKGKKETLSNIFKTLLHELMTGQRRVNDINFSKEATLDDTKRLKLPIAAEPKISKPRPEPNPYFKRTVLAAYIVDRSLNDPFFNKTKFQKLLYLAQFVKHLNIVSNYHHDAAGPYDNQMMRSVHSQLQQQKWFGCKKSGNEFKYFPLEKSEGYKSYFQKYWGEYQHTLDELIRLLKPLDYERCEIVATIFDCLKELKERKELVNNATLVEAYHHYHPAKKKQPRERILNAWQWMKESGLAHSNT